MSSWLQSWETFRTFRKINYAFLQFTPELLKAKTLKMRRCLKQKKILTPNSSLCIFLKDPKIFSELVKDEEEEEVEVEVENEVEVERQSRDDLSLKSLWWNCQKFLAKKNWKRAFFLGGVEEMEKQKIMKKMVAGKSPIISQIQNLRLNGWMCGEEKCTGGRKVIICTTNELKTMPIKSCRNGYSYDLLR